MEEFRKITPEYLEKIWKETPKHLLDVIANVLLAFLLKEKVCFVRERYSGLYGFILEYTVKKIVKTHKTM